MEQLFAVDWSGMVRMDTPLLEIFIRGTAVYLGLFCFLRIIKRQAGALGISDLLVVVLIADASQNAMANDYRSITDGMALVATIIFWNITLEWLGYHFAFFEKLVHPGPMPLIKNGRVQRANMRNELITMAELMSQLRLQGIDVVKDVKFACLEGDGKISVVTYEKSQHTGPESPI